MAKVIWEHEEREDDCRHFYSITDGGNLLYRRQILEDDAWILDTDESFFIQNFSPASELDFIFDAFYCLAEDYGRLNA